MRYTETHPWMTFELDLRNVPTRFWTLLGDACAKCEFISGLPLQPDTADELHRVYLARGARATTAIEGNSLSEDEVLRIARDELRLPSSKQYLGTEVRNILDACNEMTNALARWTDLPLDTARITYLNRQVLNGLEFYDGAASGEIRTHDVVVGRYRGAPAEDCQYLLNRLCEWLGGMDLDAGLPDLTLPILEGIVAHLYLAWIHPFADGNGRTARLMEFQILMQSGVPSPAAHLLSNHYNETRAEYYRRLERSSAAPGPDGVTQFLVYALQGFVDGLASQIDFVIRQVWQDVWTNHVHNEFRNVSGPAAGRRRNLVLDLSESDNPVPRSRIRDLTPRLADAYHGKTSRTIARDLDALEKMGLIERSEDGVSAKRDAVRAFLPLRRGA